jgi:hypothetical protein
MLNGKGVKPDTNPDVNLGLSGWLNPSRLDKEQLENLLNAKEILHHVHRIAA